MALPDCGGLSGDLSKVCAALHSLNSMIQKDKDNLQEQIYIVSGVLGGFTLLLLIVVIALSVKYSNLRKRIETGQDGSVATGDELQKRGFSAFTGRPEPPTRQTTPAPLPLPAPAPAPIPAYISPPVTSPKPGGQFSYENTGYSPQRNMGYDPHRNGNNPMNSNGGVQVLPKNPPIRNNQYDSGSYY